MYIHQETKKPLFVKYGLNHIVALIEAKKANLVVIADDVDPIELVIFLPALCRKMGVPYVIVKSKARLGTVVHKKTAAVLALQDVKSEDQKELSTLVSAAKANLYVHTSIISFVVSHTKPSVQHRQVRGRPQALGWWYPRQQVRTKDALPRQGCWQDHLCCRRQGSVNVLSITALFTVYGPMTCVHMCLTTSLSCFRYDSILFFSGSRCELKVCLSITSSTQQCDR